MKNVQKLVAIILCLMMLSSCGKPVIGEQQTFSPNITVGESQQQEKEKITTLNVAANYTDIMVSPWNCADLNSRKAAMLLFDSPIRLSPQFKAEPSLVSASGSGTEWVLIVKKGISFSDGSALTAEDVNNSLTMAMQETSYYRSRLSNIKTHSVSGDSVKITLNTPDALFANLMTFPVAKKTNSGYIGTGKYTLHSWEGKDALLMRNPSYWGKPASIEQIRMVDLPKQDIATYSLKLGEIDCLYTEGVSSDMSNLSTSDYPVVSNQLIFIGANAGKGHTANPTLRKAISAAIDRKYLIQSSFETSAVASSSLLYPTFMKEQPQSAQNLEAAKKLLTDAGLTGSGKEIALSLLYCTDGADRAQTANQIAAQLAEAGITVKLDGRAEKEYFEALNSGSYDLYLGEILLGDNMDLSHVLTRGVRYGFGTASSEKLMIAYRTAFSTGKGWENFQAAFQEEYPVIPLAFRNGNFSFSRKYSVDVTATVNDLFYNIDQWQ